MSQFADLYETREEIGNGAYASVHKCIRKFDSSEFAVKIVNKKYLSWEEVRNIKNEIKILENISHGNVIELIDVFDDGKHVFMVLELCQSGDLFDKIIQSENKMLSERESAEIIYQLCDALQYMHENGVVHRDLKSENILIDKDEHIKLSDFGLAHFTPSLAQSTAKLADFSSFISDVSIYEIEEKSYENILMETSCGTPEYVAPEVIEQDQYNYKCDMWSLGVILYNLLSGTQPFGGDNWVQMQCAIINADYNFKSKRWNCISKEAKNLIDCLLNVDVKRRYTTAQVKNHPWIKKYITK